MSAECSVCSDATDHRMKLMLRLPPTFMGGIGIVQGCSLMSKYVSVSSKAGEAKEIISSL